MSFSLDIYNLLIRYTKDSENKEITLKDLQHIEWWRCVWGSYKAKSYYKIDGFYERLSDVPEGLTDYWIVADDVATQYFTWNGNKIVQKNTKETCRKIYG